MSNKEIAIDTETALAQIASLQQTLEGQLQELAANHTAIGDYLSQSAGEFADQIKTHLESEQAIVNAAVVFYSEMITVLTHTVNEFSRVDDDLSKAFENQVKGGML